MPLHLTCMWRRGQQLRLDLHVAAQGKPQLLPPATLYYPFPTVKIHTRILGVIYGVLLWADMNTATPLGARGRSVIGGAATIDGSGGSSRRSGST